MKIFICASKHLYHLIPPIKEELEKKGHSITLPNSFDDPMLEEKVKAKGREEHIRVKSYYLRKQIEKVMANDAILVMNFEKRGQQNYIGGATFLEIFKAFELGKPVFLMNPIPENNSLSDELIGMNPIILNQDLSKIDQ
ncbi:hypothetical protein JW851_00280 [Candidatus Woesearchaeota archaeon]|nr:hypothetical protein [Candidatus Woesearchaeota archaeon]